jgi:uncharacterized SAM-binding protein YcdF (DUF218 family)
MRRFTLAVTGTLLAVWLASFLAVVVTSRRDAAATAAAIVVLGAAHYNGAPSPVFRARLDHAADVWRRGLAPRVIVAGGTAAGDTVSEAEAGRRYLLHAGLPDSAVWAEPTGRSSEVALRAVARRLPADARRVVLVSDGFHLLRLAVIARRLGLEPLGSPAPASPIHASWHRELAYFLAESLKVPVALLITRST